MAKVTKISMSLPSPLVAELKREARERGMPVSQLVTETLERKAKAARFRAALAELYGPITETDREAGRALLTSARTPAEILGDE